MQSQYESLQMEYQKQSFELKERRFYLKSEIEGLSEDLDSKKKEYSIQVFKVVVVLCSQCYATDRV